MSLSPMKPILVAVSPVLSVVMSLSSVVSLITSVVMSLSSVASLSVVVSLGASCAACPGCRESCPEFRGVLECRGILVECRECQYFRCCEFHDCRESLCVIFRSPNCLLVLFGVLVG